MASSLRPPHPTVHVALHGPQGAACLAVASAHWWRVNLCVRVEVWAWGRCDRCFLDQNIQYSNIILYLQNSKEIPVVLLKENGAGKMALAAETSTTGFPHGSGGWQVHTWSRGKSLKMLSLRTAPVLLAWVSPDLTQVRPSRPTSSGSRVGMPCQKCPSLPQRACVTLQRMGGG